MSTESNKQRKISLSNFSITTKGDQITHKNVADYFIRLGSLSYPHLSLKKKILQGKGDFSEVIRVRVFRYHSGYYLSYSVQWKSSLWNRERPKIARDVNTEAKCKSDVI